MTITLHGAHTEHPPEISFGHNGYKKIVHGKCVECLIGADGRRFSIGSKIRLVSKHKSSQGHGLTDIPLQSEGIVVGFDVRPETAYVLRVTFQKDRKRGILSVRPSEVELVSD